MDLRSVVPLSIALAIAALTVGLALTDAFRVHRTHRITRHPDKRSNTDQGAKHFR